MTRYRNRKFPPVQSLTRMLERLNKGVEYSRGSAVKEGLSDLLDGTHLLDHLGKRETQSARLGVKSAHGWRAGGSLLALRERQRGDRSVRVREKSTQDLRTEANHLAELVRNSPLAQC